MATHFYQECPAMAEGDEKLDLDSLDIEDWVYDCETCQYIERVKEEAWSGGFYSGVQATLYSLDEVQAAINVGRSKFQVFRRLITDYEDNELVLSPNYRPLLIMTMEEIAACQCPTCDVVTSYSSTEDGVALWVCINCGYKVRLRNDV